MIPGMADFSQGFFFSTVSRGNTYLSTKKEDSRSNSLKNSRGKEYTPHLLSFFNFSALFLLKNEGWSPYTRVVHNFRRRWCLNRSRWRTFSFLTFINNEHYSIKAGLGVLPQKIVWKHAFLWWSFCHVQLSIFHQFCMFVLCMDKYFFDLTKK